MPSRTPRKAKSSPAASSTDWFPLALFALFAVACTQSWTWQKKRRSLSFRVPEDSPLYEPAKQAAAMWSAAIGRPVTVTADGHYPIFIAEHPDCWDGTPGTNGCSLINSDPENGYIAILPHVTSDKLYGVILHEMGHHLRGLLEPEHLDVPDALMAQHRQVEEITPEDIEFVCENFDCNPFELS